MAEEYTLRPTWANGSTGVRGPFSREADARRAATLLLMYRRAELKRLVLQRPDGSKEELLKGAE